MNNPFKCSNSIVITIRVVGNIWSFAVRSQGSSSMTDSNGGTAISGQIPTERNTRRRLSGKVAADSRLRPETVRFMLGNRSGSCITAAVGDGIAALLNSRESEPSCSLKEDLAKSAFLCFFCFVLIMVGLPRSL